ncbi:MAG: response regulator [Rhodospirillales bacterium]|nr:MAG: response regulator [Rhodospirillales bacterium]
MRSRNDDVGGSRSRTAPAPTRVSSLARRLIRAVTPSAEAASSASPGSSSVGLPVGLEGGLGAELGAELGTAQAVHPALFHEAPVAIAMVDADGRLRAANRAFRDLVGGERLTAGCRLTDCIEAQPDGGDRPDLPEVIARVSGGQSASAQRNGVTVVGNPVPPLTVHLRHVAAADGKPGALIHVVPQTDRRRFDARLAHAQALTALGQLAGGVAHDFNNMLTLMLGLSELLLTRHGPGDPSHGDLRQLRENALRSRELVRQLLAFSRRQHLQPEIMAVDQVLGDLRSVLMPLLTEKVRLRFELNASSGRVRADPGQFNHVIANLAVNARDAMPHGGDLIIRTREAVVAERRAGPEIMPSGCYVVIDVADTGSGIPKEVQNHIFEPFFSTKDMASGSGLGLATVHGIVRQSGGYVFLDSAPGRGSTFSIFLPAVEHGAAPASAPIPTVEPVRDDEVESPEPAVAGRAHVLLVEDERAVRAFAARALRISGHDVTEVGNAEAALEVLAAAEGAIDLVVSDVVMPGMDGFALAREIRRLGRARKILFISGYAPDALAPDLVAAGDVGFLAKPFTLADLAQRVREMLAS